MGISEKKFFPQGNLHFFNWNFKVPRCLKAMDAVAATKTTVALNNLRGVSSSPSVYGATTLLIIMLMPVNGAISAAGAKA